MSRRWVFAPLAVGIVLVGLLRLIAEIRGAGIEQGEPLGVLAWCAIVLVVLGVLMVVVFAVVRFIVWASR